MPYKNSISGLQLSMDSQSCLFPIIQQENRKGIIFSCGDGLINFRIFPPLSIFLLFCCCKKHRVSTVFPGRWGSCTMFTLSYGKKKKQVLALFINSATVLSLQFFSENEDKNLNLAVMMIKENFHESFARNKIKKENSPNKI